MNSMSNNPDNTDSFEDLKTSLMGVCHNNESKLLQKLYYHKCLTNSETFYENVL